MNAAQIIDIKERIAISQEWKPHEPDFILDCINAATAVTQPEEGAVLHNAPNYLGRIDQIWAFLSIDEGGEGVCAAPMMGLGSMPLIAADKRRLDQLKPMARGIAHTFNKPVRLAKFTKREDVEIYQP